MPCLYSLKTMYRRLPFIILLSILAVFALRASVVAPSILVQNYSVDDYKASCQNWDLAVSYHGILYVANNSGLVTFDGNTWNTYPLPDKTPIYKVSFQNDSIYTQGKSSLGYWLYDELGNLEYHPIDTLPSHVGFDNPETNYTIPKDHSKRELTNGYKIRRAAIDHNIPLITNARLASAFIDAFCNMNVEDIQIKSWQEYK